MPTPQPQPLKCEASLHSALSSKFWLAEGSVSWLSKCDLGPSVRQSSANVTPMQGDILCVPGH